VLTGHDTVSVGALLVAIIVGLKDHSLLTGVAALEEHDNLTILQNCGENWRQRFIYEVIRVEDPKSVLRRREKIHST